MRYLETQVRVENARRFEERPVYHDRRLLMVAVQIHASARDLLTVYVLCKIIIMKMRETERIPIQRAEKFLVLHYRE